VRFCRPSVYSKRLHSISFDVIRSACSNPPGGTWEDILGAGNIQERIPQIDPRDHAASAIFLFHLQGRSSA
jgi:hypothetical protein